MKNDLVKVGVIGVGHLGQHHAKHYKNLSDCDMVGIFDVDDTQSAIISRKYNIPSYHTLESLIKKIDAVSIVTPTKHHSAVAKLCIER